MTTVVVVSRDREIEELLRESGMQARALHADELSSLVGTNRIPDVVILDTRGGDGIPVSLGPLKRQHPSVGVVIVAAALEPALLLEAMRAGVNELVADPVTQGDLEKAIGRVLGQRAGGEIGKIYGFVGAKGGVGTTTVAVNVAAALGKGDRESRTLLIDMHQAGGDAAVFVGAEPKFSILDVITNTHRLDQTYLNSVVTQLSPRLDLLASSDRAFAGQLDPAKVRAVLEFVSRAYTYVVLDLPRSDATVLDGLDQVTTIFLVANQELATVKSGVRMATTLRQRFGRDKIKVLMSRSDRQADIGLDQVERAVGTAVAYSFPSDYRASLQAINKGRPLVSDDDSDLATAFTKFAGQLTGVTSSSKEQAGRSGLFSRLTQSRK